MKNKCNTIIIKGIIVQGIPIDTRFVGTHIVMYNVKDAAGNSADEVIRIVSIANAPTPPVPELGTFFLTITGIIGLFGIVRLSKKSK